MVSRILYLSRTWAMGGAQSIILSLIRSLPREHYEILVAPYETGVPADGVFAAEARKAGAILTAPVRWTGWSSLFSAQTQIARIARDNNIDLIHTHDDASNLVVGLGRRSFPQSVVASAYGWWELNAKLKFLYEMERRFALTRFDGVYTVSHDMARKLRRSGVPDENLSVIHTGLDLSYWAPRGTRDKVRSSFGIGKDAFVVGAVGRISHEKGHDHLLAAMKELEFKTKNVTALLVGTGPDTERLKSTAATLGLADRVILPGYFQDGPAALEAMDVAVLPSVLEEGFPTASVEAQAVGLPIIASDIGGTRETMVDGRTGLLVPPGDHISLAAAIIRLATDVQERCAMGTAARNHVANRFHLQRMLNDMNGFYQRHLRAVTG